MACSTKTLKIFALISDVIYAIFGCIVTGIGIYMLIKFEYFHATAFTVLGMGVIVVICAAFGALAAARESSRLSKTYVGVLIVVMILQILTIGFLLFFKPSLLNNVATTFDHLWRDQPLPITPDNTSGIASLERWLECCGNSGPNDYVLPPNSCYNTSGKLSLHGCRQTFLDFIDDSWSTFNIIALVLVVAELICGALAYVLANSIMNRWRRSNYYPK